MEEWFHVKHDRMVELQEIAFRVRCLSPIGCWGLVFHVKREGVGIEVICLDVFVGFWGFDVWSLFSRWENPSTPTGRRSKRTCHLTCLLLFPETSHAWGGWINFCMTAWKINWCFTWNTDRGNSWKGGGVFPKRLFSAFLSWFCNCDCFTWNVVGWWLSCWGWLLSVSPLPYQLLWGLMFHVKHAIKRPTPIPGNSQRRNNTLKQSTREPTNPNMFHVKPFQ